MWMEGVCCQKFLHAGRLGRLFGVRSQDRGEGGGGHKRGKRDNLAAVGGSVLKGHRRVRRGQQKSQRPN
jgi:hypothetical protein